MRVMSVVKVMLLAGAVALPSGLSVASAKTMKVPPGACAFQKKAVSNGAMCSYECNPANNWCSQQMCSNGAFVHLVNCYGSFCSQKCG
jgi:hypothetical protein